MWHDAPCFLLTERGSAWKAGSDCSDRLPRPFVASLPYTEDEDDVTDDVVGKDGNDSCAIECCGDEVEEEADEADDAEDGRDSWGDDVRDSDRAELGEEDVDMSEQSEPRRPPCLRRPAAPPSPTDSSARFPTVGTAAVVGEGSGADSSCCKNESISSKGSGDSGSAIAIGRNKYGGCDGMLVSAAGESDRNQGGEWGRKK